MILYEESLLRLAGFQYPAMANDILKYQAFRKHGLEGVWYRMGSGGAWTTSQGKILVESRQKAPSR